MTPDPRLVASPALSHIRNVETPCGRRPEVGFNTCGETSELSASRRYSCLFCTHITSLSHIRNVETPCGRRPEVGFNTCSEMSISTHVAKRVNCPRAAGIRALFCSHIISFHHISNSGSRHTSVASQRRITSHSPCRRCMSQAPAQDKHEYRITALQKQPFPK